MRSAVQDAEYFFMHQLYLSKAGRNKETQTKKKDTEHFPHP